MGILDDLLGNEQLQKQYKDFVKRYGQGAPARATPIKRFWSGIMKCTCRAARTVRSGGARGAG